MKQNNNSLIQQLIGVIYLIKKGQRNKGIEVLEKLIKALEVAV